MVCGQKALTRLEDSEKTQWRCDRRNCRCPHSPSCGLGRTKVWRKVQINLEEGIAVQEQVLNRLLVMIQYYWPPFRQNISGCSIRHELADLAFPQWAKRDSSNLLLKLVAKRPLLPPDRDLDTVRREIAKPQLERNTMPMPIFLTQELRECLSSWGEGRPKGMSRTCRSTRRIP